jgi:hypothetical protein
MAKNITSMKPETLTRLFIFFVLLFSYGYFFPRWADPNQNSRLDMVVAVVDDGTLQIDKYVENTVDYAKVGEHYYSDKAPGIAFLGIPVYWGLRMVFDLPIVEPIMGRLSNSESFQSTLNPEGTGVQTQKIRFALAQVILTFILSSIPSAVLGLLIFSWLGRFTSDIPVRLVTVLIYGLLTPAFIYANAFYGHQLSAVLLFGAYYLITDIKTNSRFLRAVLIGLLLAYSVVTEYPTILIVGVLFLLSIWYYYRAGKLGHLFGLGLSAGVIAIGWMVYNNYVFGGPLNLGYSYSELWQDQHQTGFMSLSLPSWEAVWGITFGVYRGLFFFSPILLLAIPGIILWWRAKLFRMELIVTSLCSLSMFFFNSTSAMWWGGFAVGPRYLLPGLPFLILPVFFILKSFSEKTIIRWIVIFLGIWSCIMVWGVGLAGQSFPPDTIYNPVPEYAIPNWLDGNIARNLGTILGFSGPLSLLPWLVVLAIFLGLWVFLFRQLNISENTIEMVSN